MVKELLNLKMEQFIQDNGEKACVKDVENYHTLQGKYMMAFGKKARSMVRES